MTSADFNKSNFNFAEEQSLVNNPLEPDNIAGNSSSLLTSEIIFVDETVKDYQQLVAEIDADVYRLDSNLDGIEQITEVLSQYEDISGVHLISHGDEGSLKLGATELNQENLEEYSDRLKLWNNSLLNDADFLIYGCDVAEGDTGKEFVSNLSNLIGADIAASNDLTGNEDLGGDWDLEYSTGDIEVEAIANDDYQDVLATASLDNGILIYASDGIVSEQNNLDLYISNDELFIQESNSETITADVNLTQVDDSTVKVDLSSVTGISIQTDGGKDSITLDSSFSGFTGSLNLDAGSVTDDDSVTINSDLYTAGGDFSIKAESITIPQNTTISTRQISGTDYLNDASVGNSGAIDFDARKITLDGTNLYAHVLYGDITNTAGNIDIHVKEEAISTAFGGFDTFDIDVSLDPVNINVDIDFDSADDSVATIDLIGANLLGGDITLDADASYAEDEFVSSIDDYSLFLGAAIAEATATVNIDSNSFIDASSLTAEATTNADAIVSSISLGFDAGIAYSSLTADAEVIIDGTVIVDNDLNLNTQTDNTLQAKTDLGGYTTVAGGLSLSELNTNTKTQIGTTANISVGGNLSVTAETIDSNTTSARSTTGTDGKVGIAAAISLEDGSTEALIDATNAVVVGGNVTIDANQYSTGSSTSSKAGVNTNSTGDLISDAQFAMLTTAMNKVKGIFSSKSSAASSQTNGSSSTFDIGAAVTYAKDINDVTARIGDGAIVKATGGAIDLDATAANRPNVSAVSVISKATTSTSTGVGDDAKFAGSAGVTIGDYNSNAYAYIGDSSVVDAAGGINIESEALNDYSTTYGINFYDVLAGDEDWVTKYANFNSTFATYLNSNLGLNKYVFDSWSQANNAAGAEVGIAGSVTILGLNQTSEAYIGDNAQINQDTSLRTDNQTVAINANNLNESVHFGGNIKLPGVTGDFTQFAINVTTGDVGTNNDNSVGGTALILNYDNNTEAKIGDGVKLYADSLEVDADTTVMSIAIAASGGKADNFGFNGTGTWAFVDNDTIARIHSGADIEVGDNTVAGSTAALVVEATDSSYVINVSGGVVVSENIGIGASIGLNTIDRNTQAYIGTPDDETAPSSKSNLIVDGDVAINAENSGYIGSFALAAAVTTEETFEQPESTADYSSVADDLDAAWGIGISGEVGINEISDNTEAYISDIDIESSDIVNIQPDIELTAVNDSEILTVGGSVAISLYDPDSAASAGIAGSFGKNKISNSTKAYAENSAIDGGNLTLLADNDVDILSVNASGAGDFNDKGFALAGSVAINEINNDTLAYLSDADITAVTVDLDAADNSTIFAVAGSLAYGGQGGIGASVAINVMGDLADTDNNKTKAYVLNTDLDVDTLDITGKNDSEITSIAVSVAASKDGMAGAISVTYNRIHNDTEAYILNDGSQSVDVAGDINILAQDNSAIYSHAYPVSASFNGSAVGLSLAINEITNNTISYVDRGTINAENLTVKATDDRTVQSIAVGGAIANRFGVSGSISVVEIGTEDNDNQTLAYIGSSAVVTTQNNIVLEAEDNSEIFSLAGNVSFGASGAIGVANSTLSTHNKVKAYVEGDADVSAFGLISDATVLTGIVDSDFEPEEDKIRGLAISAVSTRSLENYAVSGSISGSNLAVAASASITLLDETTEAYIGDGATVNSDNSNAGDDQGVYVRAGNHTELIGAGGGVSGSGSTGIGAGGDGSMLSHTTKAYIGDAAQVNTEKQVLVNAYGSQDIESYAASGSFGGTLAISGSVSYIGINNATYAYIDDNAIVTSQGNILVYAEDITDANPFAGNLAVGGNAGIGASIGIIDLDKDTQAFLGNNTQVNALANHSDTLEVYDTADNNNGYNTVTGFKGLAVNAYSSEDIDTIAVGGSAAGTFGFAGSLTYSEIDSDTLAYTGSSTNINQQAGANSAQDVNITAVNDLDIYALDGAVAVAGATSIAGAVDIANIRNGTEAFIGAGSIVDAENDIKVNALNDKTLESLVVSGSASGTAALGGSVTVYNLGGKSSSSYEKDGKISDALEADGSTAEDSLQDAVDNLGIDATLFDESALSGTDVTTAYVGAGATVNAGNNLEVNAQEDLDLDSFLGQATASGTIAIGGSVGVVNIENTTKAFISDSAAISTSNNITVNAEFTNDTDVTSLAGTASATASIGGAVAVVTDNSNTSAYSSGTINSVNNLTINADSDRKINATTGNASVSLKAAAGASVGVVEIGGSTNAYLGGTVIDASNINVTANNLEKINIYTLAISGGIGADASGSVANATADSKTNAYIANSADIGTTGTVGTVDVTATYTPELITFAEGYGGSAGLSVGVSDAYGIIESDTKAYIGNNAGVKASNFNLTAEQQLPTSGLAIEADATASGGALIASVNAATATTKDESSVNTNVNSGVDLDITDSLALTATLISDRDAFADGYNGGILALGFNFAFAESDTNNKINFASGAKINAGNLSISADGTENNYAEAIAGGGGVISGRASEATTDSVSNTQVNINSDITVDTLDLQAEHTTEFNSKSDSVNASVVGGSGAYTKNTVTADIAVNFNSSAEVTANDDLDVTVNNNIEQEKLNDQNAEAASGGAYDDSAVETVTKIENSSVINVNDGAVLAVGDDDYDTIDNLDFTIVNDVDAVTRSKLANGGAISSADADAKVTNDINEAIINIEDADITSTHDINFSTRAVANLETKAKASAWGVSGVSQGSSLVEATIDNEINLNDGASITAEGDANFYVGEDIYGNTNDISLDAKTDLWNKSGSAMKKKHIDAESDLTLNNLINIHSGAELATSENINLVTNDEESTYSVKAEGEGTDLYKQVASGVSKLVGGNASSVITSDSTDDEFNNGVNVDGSLIAGQNNEQHLYITEDGGNYSYDMSDQIDSEPTVTTEDITASIDATISALETERSQYENSDDDGEGALYLTLSAEIEFWENEKAKIGDGDIEVINLPDVSASVGSINIAGGYLTGTGNIEARGDALINIKNSTDAYLRVNDVNINDNYGGELFFNNAAITSNEDLNSSSFNSIVTGSDLGDPEINIVNETDSILEIKGSIINRNGLVYLKNTSGSIYVTDGEISAKSIDIESGESFFLSDGYLFSVDSSPEALWNSEVQEFIGNSESDLVYENGSVIYGTTDGVTREDAESNPSTVNSKLSEAENPDGGVSAESSIFIASEYINISGNLSSGVSDYSLTIDSSIDSTIGEFKTAYNTSSNQNSIDFSSEYDLTNYLSNASGKNISGYYNPETDSIVINDLETQGGYIQLVGNILSTGNGNIEVMDGFGNISIDNKSSYDLQLNTLDTGGEGAEGKIVIIDNGSGTPITTTYTKDDTSIVKTVNGVEVNSDTNLYKPQEVHPYNWYYQKEQNLTLTPIIGSASAFAGTNALTIPDNYQIYGDSLYFLTNSKKKWNSAQDEALTYGGNLVTINDAGENAWVNQTFSSYGDLWLGYSDSTNSRVDSTEGNFIWVGSDTSTYSNWISGQPNNKNNEDYAEIHDSGEWNDAGNDEKNYGVIEIPLDEVEFDIDGIDTTYETQNPEVYVYESPNLSQYSGWVKAIASAIDGILNFTKAVTYPSYKSLRYSQGDLQGDEANNRVTLDIASHYVNAVPHQYDIAIDFFGYDTGKVDVSSTNDIWLNNDITSQGGDVILTSTSGSILANSAIAIETDNLNLNAANTIGDSNIAIGTSLNGGKFDATATGDIYLEETTGDLTVDTVTTSGNVNIEAYGNLEADSSNAKITGEEINLTSNTGNIGSDSLDINIDSGSDDTAGVTLDAAGDINITEASGDLYLVSADSNNGDVSISVSNGDLIDHNPEEIEDLAARAELLDTTWSEMELTDEDISTTDTNESGAASALAAEAVTAYEQSKESEYQLYWQYRNLTQVTDDDGNVTGYTYDEYDANYVYSFGETETTQLEELGYSDSAISELADNKTEQYHTIHAELEALSLTDIYNENYSYTATADEEAEITDGAVWTVDELTRVINPSLLLPVSDTEVDIEADNIQADNLTLNVGGGIGTNEGNITITVRDSDGDIIGISDEDLLYLLSAESKDITYYDDSDNEVVDVSLNVDSVYSIAIAQIDDLDFEATGELDVTTTADAYLGSEGDVTINDLDVGNNEIRLKSGNGITGTDNSTHITADNIVIEAGDSSIGSSTNPIEIETNTITARGNNDIYINQASGDLAIEQIYSGDNVDLTVVGKVSDANDTDDENIRSTDIAIDSSNNSSLGSSDNYLDVYVESGGTYEMDTSQDAYILNTYGTGIINIDVTGTTGTLSYSEDTYTITDSSSGTNVNFIGFDTINLNFASQDNNFTVESLASEATLNIVGDSGNDSIELSNDLEGTVTIDGGTGTNTLILNDSDDTAANSYQVTETEITGHIDNAITYSNIDNIEVQGGSNSNDTLTVTNETDTTRTITADNSSITDSFFPDISHTDIETIDYYAESGSKDLDLTSFTSNAINLTVYSNLGDSENTLDIDAPGNQADIVVAVDENASNLKVADIDHASNSFALSGTDAAQFEIVNSNELHFIATPDFETQSSYELIVTANGTDEINLTISITDINETPTLSLDNSSLSIAEDTDTTSGVKIGDITITDDALGEETLSLSGDDAELFEIINETELYLVAGTELDYETNPDLDVTVTADDGTFSVDLDITVSLTDVNEIASVDFDYVSVNENQVLVLDGEEDYVETNSDVINLTSADFTLEAWIQTSETNQGIIGKEDGDSSWENGEKAFYVNSSGNVEFIGRNNGKITGNTVVNDGGWHHVMVVWDATNEQGYIYVDGIEDTASDSYTPNKEDKDGDTLKLGLAYTDDYFSGKLDRVVIWDKALSYEEIQTNLATTLTGTEDNIVAYYNFENDSTTEVVDVSGTYSDDSHHGTIQGDVYKESDRTILTIAENTDTTSAVKIADINISDDALGTNNLTLSGDDSSLFELDGTELYLSAGVTLDYETNPILDITVEVEDETVGATPDDTVNLRIVVGDSNDAPVATAELTEDSLPEDTDTTERIKVADLTITDTDTLNTDYTLSLAGDDAGLFELDGTELYLVAGATLDYETHPDLNVSVRVDDPSLGDTFDSSLGIIVPVTNVNEVFTIEHSNTNQSLTLNGEGAYADTNAAIVNLSRADFTLEAWIKTSATGQVIIAKNNGDTSWGLGEKAFYLDDEGKLVFSGNGNSSITGTTLVNDDQWHHVAVVWNNTSYIYGNGSIYVDGVNDTAGDSYRATHTDRSGNTLKIGFPRSSNDDYFSGKIDEVRIWNKALSASEISDNFTRTVSFTGDEDNIVAYYNFQTDSIYSPTVSDQSGNGYNLTLVDGAITGLASDLAIKRDDHVVFFAENSADDASVTIADITLIDDDYTTSDLILTGDDADRFSISGTEILLNEGETFDYETNGELNFTIEFSDRETIEAAEDITVKAIDVLELTNTIAELDENIDTSERIQVAQLDLTEAALNSNDITLSGDDAEYFEVEDFVLYLKADTTLDYETQSIYNVTVGLNDVVGSTADATVDFTLTLNDVNDAPTAINLTTDSTNYTNNLFLSGNDNYIETNAGILDLTADFTLETWIQTTEDNQGIFVKNDGDTRSEDGEKSLYIRSGKLRFFSSGDLRFFGNGDGFIYGNTKVNDGKLHHVSLVWDSTNGEGSIYVDGVLDATREIDNLTSDNSSNTIKIGSPDYYQATKHFTGFLGDIRFWDVARTQEEILAGLSTTLTGTETGLVANYNNFNSDYSNTTITDTTGNYDGTLINYDATLTKITLPENINTASSIKLAEFTLTDEDASNTNQVTITGDYSDRFEIVTTAERNYELHLAADATIDYETTPEIEINIEVSDSDLDDEAIIVQTFTVVVANENEAPSLTAETTVTELDEDTATDERIELAEINIIDEDNNDNLNLLTLTGDDAEHFAIDNNKVYLQAGTTLDYEIKTQFDVTVELDDPTFGTGIDDSVDLSIVINDANDAANLIVTNNNDSTRVLSLDGGSYEDGDYVEIDSELLDLDTSYTFEAWFKTSQNNRGIFIKGDGDNKLESGEKALFIHSSGKLRYVTRDIVDTGFTYYSPYSYLVGDTVVTDGEWHHVAFVLDQPNSTAYIYLDGNLEEQETDTLVDSADNEGDTLRLGTWNNSSFFNGEMRDIRFWNTARSQTEIQSNLNSELTGTESGLVAYYDLSNSSDTQIIDQTANGIDGTLVDDASKIETLIIPENTETGSNFEIADLAINDEDTANEFLDNSLSLSGADSEFLEIVDNKLYFKADTILDYETKTQYDFTVELDDGTFSNSVNFEIGITDINEALSLSIESTTTLISEDTDTSSSIKVANLFIQDDSQRQDITLTSDDGDKFQVVDAPDDFYNFDLEADYDSDTPNFSIDNIGNSFTTNTSSAIKIADLTIADGAGITGFILSGDDAASFEIVNDSELYLQAGVTIDVDTSFDVTVEASDGIDTETSSLSVSLSELDADVKELYLKADETIDYETNPQLDVTIEASDGEYSDSGSYSLVITDVDEAPIFTLENTINSLKENTNTTGGYKVADLSISDDDANDNTITISGDDADKFEIINNSELYLIDGTVLDYETQTEYNIAITVSDITNSTSVDYTLEVINQIENPLTISFTNGTFDGTNPYNDHAVLTANRDTSERIKIADVVITGGEGNETFTLREWDADDYEIEGNTIYLKAGIDLSKYGDGEAFAEFKVNVDGSDINEDGSDTSKNFYIQIISPELEMGYDDFNTYLDHEKTFTLPDTVDVASGSIEYELELYNWGYDTLTIEGATITGTHSDDFSIVGNPSFPLSIESESAEFFTLGFDPSSGGELSAVLEVTSNDGEENPYVVYLTGTGIGSEINVAQGDTDFSNGEAQDFGIAEIDTETNQQTFTITNTGTEALSISDIVITGTNSDEFTTDFSLTEIAAGASADMTVSFTPTAGGDRTATLSINNNDDDESAFAINLTGNGAIAEIDLVQGDTELPSGTTQDFGSVNVDNGEIQQTFTIQNTGSKTLNIGDISVTGTNASYFILENSSAIANTQLEAGDSKDLTITFNPRTAETTTATLTINSDDSDESTYTINLTGTGTESTEVSGSDNDDNINNDDSNQTIDAGAGDDTVTGNDNGERLTGGDGADQVYGEDGNDRAYGDAGDDVIVGGDGRDFLRGGADNDIMFGGADNDYLVGDDGEDYLDGEAGSDRLRGGNDSDTFVLRSGDGTDLILDFDVDVDHFELDSLEVSELTLEDDGSFGLIKFGDETLAQVRNVTASQLEEYFTNRYSS